MTTPISAIAPIGGLGSVAPAAATAATGVEGAAAGGNGFSATLGGLLDQVNTAQGTADNLAVQAAAGANIDPAAITIATTQATLMTQLAATVQSKAVAAFNTIMGMQA